MTYEFVHVTAVYSDPCLLKCTCVGCIPNTNAACVLSALIGRDLWPTSHKVPPAAIAAVL